MDKKHILNRIMKYKVVSFDIFDTLLKRDVFFPTDVFVLVEREYNRRFGQQLNFARIRENAEKVARDKSIYQDVTFNEIYSEMNLSVAEKNILQQLELDAESSLLHSNIEIQHVYEECLKSGKTIYIVSDMYLPKSFLERILKREGISGYKYLYLSCEQRAKKGTGALFAKLCKTENINRKDIIHIGDSIYADYIGAMRVGIRALHIKRNICNTLYSKISDVGTNVDKRSLFAFINTRVPKFANRGQRIGYELLGPIIYSYCKWIHDSQVASNKKSKVRLWFAARDMYLFCLAYRLMYQEEGDCEYVYISRKSLRPILTQAVGDLAESGNVLARGEYTLEELIRYMGYSLDDIDRDKKTHLEKKYNARKLNDYKDVKDILASDKILHRERMQASEGMKYLKEHGLFDTDILLVDVGWHGTTQYILQKIQKSKNENLSVKGLYIGCLDGTDEKIGKDNYKAFLFDEQKVSPFAMGIILFESLVLAPHGSVIRYQMEGGIVIPVLNEAENVSRFITDVQYGAIQFVKEFRKSILDKTIFISAEMGSEAFVNLATKPKKTELLDIGQLEYDNFYCQKMADPKRIIYYILYPNFLLKDLKYSPWRVGFLYKLFKIRLPYAKIYSFIRKTQGKQT